MISLRDCGSGSGREKELLGLLGLSGREERVWTDEGFEGLEVLFA